MIKTKKQMFIVIGVFTLILLLSGTAYAFFNYTRTGGENSVGTGRIYFNTSETRTVALTDVFPVSSAELNTANLASTSVRIVGDTTYTGGEEYQVTLTNVNNVVNNKNVPIHYIATYTANTNKVIGTASNAYFSERGSTNNLYYLTETGIVEEGKQILVGYLKAGAEGIDGTLTIKAWIDSAEVAISDTHPNEVTDTNNDGYLDGTTSEWVDGRVVLTTTEWNSFQSSGTPISFKIRAESNEGIWVEEPTQGIESCPGCKFVYYVVDRNDIATAKWTTWNNQNQTPTQITSGLYDNYEELIEATGKNYFLGVKLNSNNEVTNAYACGVKDNEPFCLEGTSDGSKYTANQTLLQGANLYNNSCTVESDYTGCGPWDNRSVSANANPNDGDVNVGVGLSDRCEVAPIGCFGCIEYEAVEPAPGGGGATPQ